MNNICPNCKNFINPTDKKCRVCGFILSQDIVQKKNYVLCPGCNNYEFNDQPKCRRCGYVFVNQYQMQYNPYPTQNYGEQNTNLIGIILSLIGLIGCMISVFLPAISVSLLGYKESVTLFGNTSDAYIILVLCVINIITILCKCKTHGLDAVAVGIVNLFIAIAQITSIKNNMNESEFGSFASIGVGIYVLIICSLLIIAGGITLYVMQKKSKKS